MKSFISNSKSLALAICAGGLLSALAPQARADVAEAADKAYAMAAKYSGMGYYMTPAKEGHGGFGVTYEFEVPVNRGLDYVFVIAGDHYCESLEVWIEAEETGNTLVKDTRKQSNGLAGVRWRSDYNGSVNVVVNFARVTSRCGWCALVGRRGTVNAPYEGTYSTVAGGATKLDPNAPKAGSAEAVISDK
jgi:hypothetical protein